MVFRVSPKRDNNPAGADWQKILVVLQRLLAVAQQELYTAKTAKNPVSSRNRVFIYSIAFNRIYNYFTVEVPVKPLFPSRLTGLAAGVIKRLLSLAAVFAVGIMELLTIAPVKGTIG